MQRVWHTRERLGAPLFNALLRGLVLADRLNTTGSLIVRIGEGRAGTPSSQPPLDAEGDERQVLFWSTTAWMWEFSKVVDAMFEAGIEGLLRFSPATLVSLREVTTRWKTEIFARMRNQAGVHLDASIIERGLKLARASGDTSAQLLSVALGADPKADARFRATFAHGVLIAGLFAPPWPGEDTGAEITAQTAQATARGAERVMKEVFGQAARDHGVLPGLMRALILDCAIALDFGEVPLPVLTAKRANYKEVNDRTKQALDVIGRMIEGWKHGDDSVAKVRSLGDELRKLRSENRALRQAAHLRP